MCYFPFFGGGFKEGKNHKINEEELIFWSSLSSIYSMVYVCIEYFLHMSSIIKFSSSSLFKMQSLNSFSILHYIFKQNNHNINLGNTL